jgi:hypothetical protein
MSHAEPAPKQLPQHLFLQPTLRVPLSVTLFPDQQRPPAVAQSCGLLLSVWVHRESPWEGGSPSSAHVFPIKRRLSSFGAYGELWMFLT